MSMTKLITQGAPDQPFEHDDQRDPFVISFSEQPASSVRDLFGVSK